MWKKLKKDKTNQEYLYLLNEAKRARGKILYRESQIEDFKDLLRVIRKLVKRSRFEEEIPGLSYYWHVDFDDGHTETIVITNSDYRSVKLWLAGEFEEDKCTESLIYGEPL